MVRVSHWVLLTALSFSAQAALADQAAEGAEAGREKTEVSLGVAGTSSSSGGEGQVAKREAAQPKAYGHQHDPWGIEGNGVFPSRGGPIDG